MKKVKIKNPFVFWIRLSIDIPSIKFFWVNRGANFINVHIWKLCFDLGMPWRNPEVWPDGYIERANTINLKNPFAILIP